MSINVFLDLHKPTHLVSQDFCNNLVYDDEIESYVCDVNMDEDDYARFLSSSRTYCPYYQSNDEYKIVRHQM